VLDQSLERFGNYIAAKKRVVGINHVSVDNVTVGWWFDTGITPKTANVKLLLALNIGSYSFWYVNLIFKR